MRVVTQGLGSVLLKGVRQKGRERSAALVMHTSRCPSRDSRRWARNATVDQSRGWQMASKGPGRRVESQATPEESKRWEEKKSTKTRCTFYVCGDCLPRVGLCISAEADGRPASHRVCHGQGALQLVQGGPQQGSGGTGLPWCGWDAVSGKALEARLGVAGVIGAGLLVPLRLESARPGLST